MRTEKEKILQEARDLCIRNNPEKNKVFVFGYYIKGKPGDIAITHNGDSAEMLNAAKGIILKCVDHKFLEEQSRDDFEEFMKRKDA